MAISSFQLSLDPLSLQSFLGLRQRPVAACESLKIRVPLPKSRPPGDENACLAYWRWNQDVEWFVLVFQPDYVEIGLFIEDAVTLEIDMPAGLFLVGADRFDFYPVAVYEEVKLAFRGLIFYAPAVLGEDIANVSLSVCSQKVTGVLWSRPFPPHVLTGKVVTAERNCVVSAIDRQ